MPQQPFVRREVWDLAADDPIITAYAEAVRLMSSRSPSDPTSWAYQAAIHGTHAANPPPTWNACKHGSWWFVAWHRMFVLRFEAIVRAAVVDVGGPADWALPYWNYGLNGIHATLPLAFRNPESGGRHNPLYVEARRPGINAGFGIPPEMTSADFALSRPQFIGAAELGGGVAPPEPQFWTATGRLEQTPHNDIHNALGGRGGWMSDPDRAAEDPIFWLHHANIDRLWAVWSGMPGHHDPHDDQRWAGQGFELFDASGQPVTQTCGDVIDILALGYTYDPVPVAAPAPAPTPEPVALGASMDPPDPDMVGATDEPLTLTGATERRRIPIDSRARAAAVDAGGGQRIYLGLDDIDAEENPGTVYGVYLDLPEGAPPEVERLHHVGNLSFFGIERGKRPRGDAQPHGLRLTMDVTPVVTALQERGAWNADAAHVTFRPLELIPSEPAHVAAVADAAREPAEVPPVTVGRISLYYG